MPASHYIVALIKIWIRYFHKPWCPHESIIFILNSILYCELDREFHYLIMSSVITRPLRLKKSVHKIRGLHGQHAELDNTEAG